MSLVVVPMVSVVMPTYNQVAFIGDSISSVLDQSHRRLELIVADGGSSDGTQALLEERQSRDARLRWFSGADSGPADALNKAMKLVRGTVIGWLNSDDLYASAAVERAVAAFAQQRSLAAVYGRAQHIDQHGLLLGEYPSLPPSESLAAFLDGCFICQPTMFFTRAAYFLLGPLDTGLKTAFDFDYWLRLFARMPGRIGFVDTIQAQSRLHPGCITHRLRREIALEGMEVLRRHLGRAPSHWALTHIREILAGARIADATPEQHVQLASFVSAAVSSLSPADGEYLMHHWGASCASLNMLVAESSESSASQKKEIQGA